MAESENVRSKRLMLTDFPDVFAQWNATRNIGIDVNAITAGSGRKVWWTCAEGHEWDAVVGNRTKLNRGCPYCSGNRLLPEKSFAVKHPKLAEQWNSEKNRLTPEEVSEFSHKKVWWICKTFPEHEWEAAVSSRSKGHGCPHCAGQTSLPEFRVLAELRSIFDGVESRAKPDLRHEADIYISDLKLAIEYDGEYYHRHQRQKEEKKRAGFGNVGIELIRLRAGQLPVYHPNDLRVPDGELSKSDLDRLLDKIRSFAHSEHFAPAISKYKQRDSFIAEETYRKYVEYLPNPFPEDSLQEKRPDLVAQWDYEKNHPLTPLNFTPGSGKKVWWRCPKGSEHVWEAAIAERSTRGCPFCSNKRVHSGNSLAMCFPEIAAELDAESTGKAADQIIKSSNKKAVWVCPEGHSYEAPVSARTVVGAGCPYCSGKRVDPDKSLAATHPEIARDWHPNRNGAKTPEEVLPRSQKKAWWRCAFDQTHEWEAVIASRTDGTGCPICSGRVASVSNNLEALFPTIAAEFNQDRNGAKPADFKPGSGKKVWWQCSVDARHEWKAQIYSRCKLNTGCPICWNERRKMTSSKKDD